MLHYQRFALEKRIMMKHGIINRFYGNPFKWKVREKCHSDFKHA